MQCHHHKEANHHRHWWPLSHNTRQAGKGFANSEKHESSSYLYHSLVVRLAKGLLDRSCIEARNKGTHGSQIHHIQGGGGLCGGNFLPWDSSQRLYFACSPEFAVGNFAPTCCEPTFGRWWLLLLADALQLSPRGLLFLPDELLVAGCCYFMVVVVISWWLLVFSNALLLPFHPCKAQYSALGPLNKGCNKQLKNCFRWLQLTWRSCDAHPAPSMFVHIVADNAWRRQTQFSTPLAVGYGQDCCLLFCIPAKNVASCRQNAQVYIA